MVQGPNYMKVDVICLKHKPDMMENAINVKITSSAEISMDAFDKQWQAYIKRLRFFSHYNIHYKDRHALRQLQSWFERTLRSQFNSSDRHDIILLDHWTVEIGDEFDFNVGSDTVPFHAIVKTPVMEHWYAHTNVDNNPGELIAYTGESRRIPLFDEQNIRQPYYHSNRFCSTSNECIKLRTCNRKKDFIKQVQAIMTECERLAEEVF